MTEDYVPGEASLIKRDLIALAIILLLVGSVLGVIYFGPSFIVMKKTFSFSANLVSPDYHQLTSVEVINTIGAVAVRSWSLPFLLINGTVSARGVGYNPDTIPLEYYNSSGMVTFYPPIPSTSNFLFANPYSVDINLYLPVSAHLEMVSISTSIGDIQVSPINATTIQLDGGIGKISATAVRASSFTIGDVNGDIEFSCFCNSTAAATTNGSLTATLTDLPYFGTDSMTTTNGNVNINLPSSGNYTITASTTKGSVSSTGLTPQLANHVSAKFGTGAATVTASTENGSIIVTGN